MTDSELRAAIERVLGEPTGDGYTFFLMYDVTVKRLTNLVEAALTTERTAIKAALPEKLKRGQYLVEANLPIKDVLLRSKNAEVYKIAYPQGWNNAIDQVNQVIDGREG